MITGSNPTVEKALKEKGQKRSVCAGPNSGTLVKQSTMVHKSLMYVQPCVLLVSRTAGAPRKLFSIIIIIIIIIVFIFQKKNSSTWIENLGTLNP